MEPEPSEPHQDSPSRSGFLQNPPAGSSNPYPNFADPPANEPAGNESSIPPADLHMSATMDATDAEPPTSSGMDLDFSYSPLSVTPVGSLSPMDTGAGADSWPPSPTLSPDGPDDMDCPSSTPEMAWAPSSSTYNPLSAGKSTLHLPDIDELLKLGFKDALGQPFPISQPVDYSFSTNLSTPSTVGAGLRNLGNTCFLNSVLQCLTHTALLVNGLQSLNHPTRCDGIEGFCVLCALRDHVDLSLTLPRRAISPVNIVNHMGYFSSNFKLYTQQDAHEFFLAFLDKLGRCFSNSQNKKESSSHQNRNLVEEIFGGEIVDRISCSNCGLLSESYVPILDMSLGLRDTRTLADALESYTKVENIEYTCQNCKVGARQKRLLLRRAPSVAVFQLKRFVTAGRFTQKFETYVELPLELDLQPYTMDNTNNETLQYHLYAIIVHSGTFLHKGHYYCFVRSSFDEWYRLDDAQVTRERTSYVLTQQGYMMFYTRRGTPWMSTVIESINSLQGPSASSTSKSKMPSPHNVDCASTSHPSAAHDDPCEPKTTDDRFVAEEGPRKTEETSSGGSKQGIADKSSGGLTSTTAVPPLVNISNPLKRSLEGESSPSKNEAHDQDQEIEDTKESDASRSKSSGSGSNPSTDPKRIKLESHRSCVRSLEDLEREGAVRYLDMGVPCSQRKKKRMETMPTRHRRDGTAENKSRKADSPTFKRKHAAGRYRTPRGPVVLHPTAAILRRGGP